jgi:hypothetical protein
MQAVRVRSARHRAARAAAGCTFASTACPCTHGDLTGGRTTCTDGNARAGAFEASARGRTCTSRSRRCAYIWPSTAAAANTLGESRAHAASAAAATTRAWASASTRTAALACAHAGTRAQRLRSVDRTMGGGSRGRAASGTSRTDAGGSSADAECGSRALWRRTTPGRLRRAPSEWARAGAHCQPDGAPDAARRAASAIRAGTRRLRVSSKIAWRNRISLYHT